MSSKKRGATKELANNKNGATATKKSKPSSWPQLEDAHASYTGKYDKLMGLFKSVTSEGFEGDAQWTELRQRIAASLTVLEIRQVCAVLNVKWANVSNESLIDSIAKELFAERLPSPVEASIPESWVEAGSIVRIQPKSAGPKKANKKATPLDQIEVGQPSEVSLRMVRKELIALISGVKVSSNQTAADVAACKAELVAMRQICGGFLQAQAAFAEREKELLAQIAQQ